MYIDFIISAVIIYLLLLFLLYHHYLNILIFSYYLSLIIPINRIKRYLFIFQKTGIKVIYIEDYK